MGLANCEIVCEQIISLLFINLLFITFFNSLINDIYFHIIIYLFNHLF